MSEHSEIEWTDATWNPLRGCQKSSAGCKHCYAERFAERLRDVAGHPYESGFDVRLVPEKLAEPLRWSRPRRVFVNSMSDLCQGAVPDDYITAVADVMAATPWHTFQVLTKHPDRMRGLLESRLARVASLRHIWWGTSIEDRRDGLPRLEILKKTKAAVPFLSVEPLLKDLGTMNLTGIAWIIVGGEAGPGARPMRPEWAESIRVQCEGQGVRFFFKQHGGARKWLTGRELNGRTYDDLPPLSQSPIADRSTRQRLTREIEARYDGRFSGQVIVPNARLVRRTR